MYFWCSTPISSKLVVRSDSQFTWRSAGHFALFHQPQPVGKKRCLPENNGHLVTPRSPCCSTEFTFHGVAHCALFHLLAKPPSHLTFHSSGRKPAISSWKQWKIQFILMSAMFCFEGAIGEGRFCVWKDTFREDEREGGKSVCGLYSR